jgi:hypothetical protein
MICCPVVLDDGKNSKEEEVDDNDDDGVGDDDFDFKELTFWRKCHAFHARLVEKGEIFALHSCSTDICNAME